MHTNINMYYACMLEHKVSSEFLFISVLEMYSTDVFVPIETLITHHLLESEEQAPHMLCIHRYCYLSWLHCHAYRPTHTNKNTSC